MLIAITLPIPSLKLSPNGRGHWMTKHRHTSRAKGLAVLLTKQSLAGGTPPPVGCYCFTYHWPSKRRRDDDNAVASGKAYMDGICQALGIDDKTLRFGGLIHCYDSKNPRLEITLHP